MGHSQKYNEQQILELIELNDDLENYFQNTIIPQLFVDANLILRKYTPLAMKQFRFTPEHIGRPVVELIDNIRYSSFMENIKEVIETEKVFEKEIQTTDLRWFQMNIIPYIIYKTGKPNGVIVTFIDITDRIKDFRELERLNAAHQTFIYSVSHDLKAPLANIEGLINELTCIEFDKEQEGIAKMLEGSIHTMRNIINDLSEIAKIEGHYQETVEKVYIPNIIQEVELIIKDEIYKSGAHISTEIKESEIKFSRKNLRSIIYNLLSNAIKYKSPLRNPEISIRTEKENEFVKITVNDNGLGIAEDKIESIFSQFSRIENNVEGTGIGLYLVKKIVDNEGGKILVNSKVGEGSEFKVYLKHQV
jgi:two-component system, OmpR family, phosphate regulon sensor histidine kinase PhoR